MPAFNVADRLLPRAHTTEEVLHVILTRVEPRGIGGQRRGEQVGMTGLDPAASDKDPTVLPLEAHAVLLERLFEDGTFPVIAAGAADKLRHPIRVGVSDFVFAGGREATGNHRDQ